MEVYQARFDHGDLVRVVHLEDPAMRVSAMTIPPSLGRHLARPVPARGRRTADLGVGEPDAGRDFLGGAREDDGVGGRKIVRPSDS